MAEATDRQGIIHQNLEDAGCDEELIIKCMSFVKDGNAQDMLPLLKVWTAWQSSKGTGTNRLS